MSSLRKEARNLLRMALAKLENGKMWIRGNYYTVGKGYCSVGAVRSCILNSSAPSTGSGVNFGIVYKRAMRELARHVESAPAIAWLDCETIVVWENDDSKSFKHIEKLFKKAIRSLR